MITRKCANRGKLSIVLIRSEFIINTKEEYYVYEWIRLDTNEPFYVGKGKGDRCYKLTRGNNLHFNNIVKSKDVAVHILIDNLDEKTAFEYEVYYIWYYRDIIGYNLTNINEGGSGSALVGERNGMYGRSWYDENTPIQKIEEWKKKCVRRGKLNGMYQYKYSEETLNKMRKAKEGLYFGENNPNYKNDTLKKKLKENPHLKKLYYSRPGNKNGRAKKVFVKDKNNNILEFGCIKECAEWLNPQELKKSKLETSISHIKKSIKENKEFLGYKFSFENNF